MKEQLVALLRQLHVARPPRDSAPPQEYFTRYYRRNSWGGHASRSGPGSEGARAEQKIHILEEIIAQFEIASILDFGCGDFYWMKESVRPPLRYHGVDVVKQLIQQNEKRFSNPAISFQCLDLSDSADQKKLALRTADMVVCLDIFGHLLNHEVTSLLQFIFDDLAVKFFLVTNRREETSADYLARPKTRSEGIDLELHPLFRARHPKRVKQIAALHPNDYFDLYELHAFGS